MVIRFHLNQCIGTNSPAFAALLCNPEGRNGVSRKGAHKERPVSLKANGRTGTAAGATATEPDPPQRIVAHDSGQKTRFAASKTCRSVECRSLALFADAFCLLLPMKTRSWAHRPHPSLLDFSAPLPHFAKSQRLAGGSKRWTFTKRALQ